MAPKASKAITTAKAASKKIATKREEDPMAMEAERRKQAIRDQNAANTPQTLSATRPSLARFPDDSIAESGRPATPPPNRLGRVPRAAALAATSSISSSAAAQTALATEQSAATAKRASSKRPLEDAEESAGAESRATTPPRALKKQRAGARVKTS